MKNKIVERIINYILQRRRNKLEKTLAKLKPKSNFVSANKILMTASEIVAFQGETEILLQNLDDEVKNIVKTCLNNPEKLLDYIEEHQTPVYRIPYANIILSKIGEEEGFIIPLKGWKAFYLNFFVGIFSDRKLKFSFKSQEMFVLRNLDVNVYYMLHQFHKWYGFKKKLPGYDAKAQQLFKENLNTMTDGEDLTIDEIVSLKDAIARDVQATEFVINLAKEHDGAKKAIDKIKHQGGADI